MNAQDKERLVEVVAEAMSRPVAERETYVRQQFTAPELQAEALSLLGAIGRAGGFMDSPTVGERAAARGTPPGESPGAAIGRYTLVRQIGEGGFGVVFLAEQREPVRRSVALKVIKLGMDTRAVVARFEQERQALAVMDHPNIAKVLDAGATEAGRPYFVMELVHGEPITAYCDRANLTIPERLQLFTQVCRAVQHAHTKGVIHRDIKPSNVLVSTQDGRPACKVIDFGIAKATQRPLTDKTVFTELRQLVGTPEYMSPEQAHGNLDIDTRTDVYSLGVVLYELLAGVTPFDPKRLRSAAYGEMQRIIREDDPPAPSTRVSQAAGTLASIAAMRRTEPRQLGQTIRGDLDWIVMRALDKDRARRYDSPGNLAADIERHLGGEPVEAAPPGAAYRVRKFIGRHRGSVLAGALIAAALLAGMTGTTVGLVKAHRASALAAEEARAALDSAARADHEAGEARRSAREADAVNTLMSTMIASANRGRQQGRADITVREVMDTASAELDAGRTTVEPRVEALLAKTIGETYRELDLLEQSERMLQRHAQRQLEIFGGASARYAGALNDLGGLVKSRGRLDDAQRLYDQARDILVPLGEAGADELRFVHINHAALLCTRDKWPDAEAELRAVIADFEGSGADAVPVAPANYILALRNLGAVLYQRQALEEAERTFNRSIALRRAAPGALTPDLQVDLHNLGALRFARGDSEGAVTTLREEVSVARRLYGDDHTEVADALRTLAVALGRVERYDEEMAAEREALDIYRRRLPPDHHEIGHTMHMLGGTCLTLLRYDEAEALLRPALDILVKSLGAGHSDAVYGAYELGLVLQHRGDEASLAEAEAMLRSTRDTAETSIAEGSKYQWMRFIVPSLLASILVDQAAAVGATAGLAKLHEAETLAAPATEKLLAAAPKMGPRMRGAMVTAALQRMVRHHTVAERLEPDAGHAPQTEAWQARLDEFQHPTK